MSKQLLNIGAVANDNTGDTLRAGGDKVNDNFNEVYSNLGNGSDILVNVTNPAANQVLRYNGTSFIPSDYSVLTSNMDVSTFDIISTSDRDVDLNPSGSGNVKLLTGGVTHTFSGTTGNADFPTIITYKNEYDSLGASPAAATYPGYYYTVSGDDNPYVNINITTGGVGNVKAKLITEYSSIDMLSDVDITTTPPTNDQVLKWNTSQSKWLPGDDAAGVSAINNFGTITGDTGSTTANSQNDTLTITGGTNITTSITGDTLTVDFNGTLTTTLAALTDTNTNGIIQGDMLYWNGTNWVPTRSPMIWWELNASGNADYQVSGPGFSGTVNDPTFYVYRGFTYAFDNTIQGGGHPFRIQSTQGLTGSAYTAGQSGSGTSILYWTVPMDAPTTLYYQCTLHATMQGTINVVV